MANFDQIRLPFRLADFLSGAYYALSITFVLVGLVAWTVHQQSRVDYLEMREKDHPTKQDLSETAIKVESRIADLEKSILATDRRLNDLDVHGTRAMADRIVLIEQLNREVVERSQELVRRVNEIQSVANKAGSDTAVIVERQNVNSEAIKALQQRMWSNGGERGPTAPVPPRNPRYNFMLSPAAPFVGAPAAFRVE